MSQEYITPDPQFHREMVRAAKNLPSHDAVIKLLLSKPVAPEIMLPEFPQGTAEKLSSDEAAQLLDDFSQQ
jgi:hypothetical protein